MVLTAATCLAMALYYEARGEHVDGQIAIAEVVMNRVAHDKYPDEVCNVTHQPSQFSGSQYWTIPETDNVLEQQAWEHVMSLSEEILVDPTMLFGHGATHYYAPDRMDEPPFWANEFEFVGTIGGHRFYEGF